MPIASEIVTNFWDKQGATRPSARVYIVGPDTPQNQLLCTCLSTSLRAVCSCHTTLPEGAHQESGSDGPRIYLRDCLTCDVEAIATNLGHGKVPLLKLLRVVLFNVDSDCRLEALVRAFKIHGIFYRKDSRALFLKGMRAIMQGEFWLRRKMLTKCVLASREAPIPAWGSSANVLSQREEEILRLVAGGDSNQEVADLLKISVHTVKTHLYNIYKKIEVPNRLQAALWASSYLQGEGPDLRVHFRSLNRHRQTVSHWF